METTANAPATTPSTPHSLLTEDWTVVILGLLIVALSLTGLLVPTPTFGWKNTGDLLTKVFTGANLTAVAGQFGFTYATALLGTLLTRKSIRSTLQGFPVVFGLTVLALLLAGNKTLKDLNLEAVIFSLGIGLAVGNLIRPPTGCRPRWPPNFGSKLG